ncbi:hypothetical protein HDV02_003337 [Globomyces sp. JEL0801]|nr:hypothetical protein HDV02_003337 [Globomyces sp. JEL0801]
MMKQIVKYFDDTISIVFLVSLISISSLLGVGSNTCLDETLGLFRYLIHHRLIEQQSVVLIFNQYDLFVSSYSALEFQGNFPDFHSIVDILIIGDISDPQIAVDYLKDLFMKELNETHRVVQVYVTSSIDTQKIESINSDLT